MMLLFVSSEAFFFLALIISYVYYSHPGGKLSDSAKFLDIRKTGVFTIFLLLSSVTIAIAESRLRKEKRRALVIWMLITVLLGAVFIIGQGVEYSHLAHLNLTISKNIFGSAFFTLTGFHGLHVILGLIVLLVITILILSGKFKPVETEVLETAAIYWHFVDIVWIVVFSVVYIGAII